MPAVIVFGASATEEKGKADTVRVAQEAQAVVEGLSSAEAGFASFELQGNGRTVWVNRDLVRMVREVSGQE